MGVCRSGPRNVLQVCLDGGGVVGGIDGKKKARSVQPRVRVEAAVRSRNCKVEGGVANVQQGRWLLLDHHNDRVSGISEEPDVFPSESGLANEATPVCLAAFLSIELDHSHQQTRVENRVVKWLSDTHHSFHA